MKTNWTVATLGIATIVTLALAGEATPVGSPSSTASHEQSVARGQYLVRIAVCNDCHTPWAFDPDLGMPRPDMTRMLSGHPAGGPDPQGTLGAQDSALIGPTFTSFKLPFGTIYSANITPDADTGIGSWTEEMFVNAFRKGRHMGGDGRGILPPMPWMWLRNLTDEDLRSIYAYLRSVPPVRNAVPDNKVSEEAMWDLRDKLDRMATALPHD